ncbi:PKD domain-containing protein [Stieleria varia]|uniref:PKD domain protein n=1 Tax=Stieleria varia TaxID=2528005 RepID=A0A5C6BA87_9BACT|nr:PKD domain-containing protein [Stieleria varia]TWU08361.1 PKD domain protein [Stieleria varia]
MSPSKICPPRALFALLLFGVILVRTIACCNADETVTASEAPHRAPPDTFIFLVDISGSMKDNLSVAVQPRLTNQSKLEQVKSRLTRLTSEFPPGTRVIVSVFDGLRSEICDLVLTTPSHRDILSEKIAGIQSRDGATVLWGSVDEELARAEKLVAEGNSRVRLVVYSDGEDSDKSPRINHQTLISRYGHVIDRQLQLDWVTLGFDLNPQVKSALEKSGVRFTKELMPLRVEFQLSKNEVFPKEDLRLTDNSFGDSITRRAVDWGDGTRELLRKTTADIRPAIAHRYSKPGVYNIRYAIETESGQRGVADTKVKVIAPSLPEVRIESPQTATLGQSIIATAKPMREDWQYAWTITGGESESVVGPVSRFRADRPGEIELQLTITDPNGISKSVNRMISVQLPRLDPVDIQTQQSSPLVDTPTFFSARMVTDAYSYRWRTSDGQSSSTPHATFQFSSSGTYQVMLTVSDRWGQTSEASTEVKVVPPGVGPVAGFDLAPGAIALGSPVSFVASSIQEHDRVSWSIDDQQLSTSKVFVFYPERYGDHRVSLTVEDRFGRTDSQEQTFVVPRPDPPVAGFTLGANQFTVGDEIQLTDISTGIIQSCRYEITEHEPWVTRESKDAPRKRVFEWTCESVGTVWITQTVEGPGGIDTQRLSIQIVPRWTPVSADFLPEIPAERGPVLVRFNNQCTGDILRCVLNPGDGTDPIAVDGAGDLVHTFRPGRWTPEITVYGPDESEMTPVVWKSPSIDVRKPIPLWFKLTAASIPIGLLGLLGIVVCRRWMDDRAQRRSDKRLSGELILRSVDDPLTVHAFGFMGQNELEEVILPDQTRIEVRSNSDESRGNIEFALEMEYPIDGTREMVVLTPNEEVEVGNYFVTYAT